MKPTASSSARDDVARPKSCATCTHLSSEPEAGAHDGHPHRGNVKYAANAFLAARIFLHETKSPSLRRVGADIENDPEGHGGGRPHWTGILFAGVGFGGSCFPERYPGID